MKDHEIEALARAVIDAYGLKAPIDLAKICREEGIELAPGQYSPSFHGRIEFLPTEGIFVIYHPELESHSYPGRVRFSICHELGHYFISEHRELIEKNLVHTTVESFRPVKDRIEAEADKFASALLIPEKVVSSLMASRGFLDLRQILDLSKVCQSSAQAAARRYVCLAEEPCVAIVCHNGNVAYAFSSDDAVAAGFTWLGNKHAPETCSVRRCLEKAAYEIVDGPTHTSKWFSGRQSGANLWEESTRLGGDYTLTLLSWQDKIGG